MNHLWLIEYLLLSCLTFGVNSQSFYTINAPGVFKSNRKYSVVATLHEATGPCSIRVGIEGPNFKNFKDVQLQPFQSQLVEFYPKQLQEGDFFLKAEGLTGFSFKNESILFDIRDEGPKIYIQTDKAVYKPHDLVKFRAVLLDEHTRPLNIADPIRVQILDSKANCVKQFNNVSFKNGLFTGEFQLSKYTALGSWKIKVIIDGTYDYSSHKIINIFNYILPKFSVYLKVPSIIVLEDGYIKVGIYGKYTFNKYVEGNATIELWNEDKTLMLQNKHINIKNLDFVDFDLKTIKNIDQNNGVFIKAILAEKYTGKSASEQHFIRLQKQRYNIRIPYEDIEFENNKPYSIRVLVKHWTGAPVLDRKTPVTMEHGNKVYESFLDGTGAATFEFDYEANSNYKFKFKDSLNVLPTIYSYENLMLNNREFYCRLKLVDKKLKLGKPVLIEVSSIVSIPYLMYTIMGHASLVKTEYIKLPPNQKTYTINITPSIEMIPRSFIYVYYVHKGNLRYEEMLLSFPYEFENQVSLSAPKQIKPGEEVTITINAQPKSYVSILAVDLGVYLLDGTYDLNRDEILGHLSEEISYSPIGSAEYPGVVSGLVTLTNAHYLFKILPPPPKSKVFFPKIFRFRQKFPETWIFDTFLINETETKLTLQIPDVITTWRLTAFSNNAVTGFGIVDKPTDITTIQNFFISLSLPNFVKRGEIVTIPISIFNYSNETLETEVILHNYDEEFQFMESVKRKFKNSNDQMQQTKRITIAADRGKIVKFFIRPIKVGEINLKVTATSSTYSDAVWQKLKVEPEGIPKQKNQALYISIPAGEKLTSTLEIEDTANRVPDSQFITFSVGGSFLVPTVKNFADLTQMPTGSGEQNMVNFAPSVLILQYLKVNNRLGKEKALAESLQSSIEVGYQQQLSFRHDNGGYSVFGIGTDEEPSTWLTAYVVRYFIKASQFIDIEENIITADLDYLASQQKSNGEFSFTGYLLNPKHENEYGLTAFILLAFLEDQKYANNYQEIIQNGVTFLNSNLNNVDEISALCLTAAVLKKAKLPKADNLIATLKSHGKEESGLKWWSDNDQNPANDIEITANAALTLLDTPGDHTSILKWLIEQRNANGGFISCYDTVAGMEALVKFSEKYTNLKNVNLKISYRAKDEQGNEVASNELYVDSNNVLNFQSHELPNTTRNVTFQIEGNGASLVQLNQQYNVNNVQEFRHFDIQAKAIMRNANEYVLRLCFAYKSDDNTLNATSNLVIIEINLPSGFYSEAENNMSLNQNNLVQRVETKNSYSTVILYLDKLITGMRYCLDIPVDRDSEILMPKPAVIKIYDYYNVSRSNTEFYSL